MPCPAARDVAIRSDMCLPGAAHPPLGHAQPQQVVEGGTGGRHYWLGRGRIGHLMVLLVASPAWKRRDQGQLPVW